MVAAPSVGSATLYYSGISVQDQSSLEISMDQSGATGDILIANTGNSPVRSVYVTISASAHPQTASSSTFIGTLNVDDYSSVAWDSTQGAAHVVVNFKDIDNAIHTITKDVSVGNSSFNGTAGARAGFNGTARGGGGLLGILGGGRGGVPGSASSSDLPLVPIGIGVVVVAVVGFFGWRHFKGKKKKESS